jgi:hypothetical protein
MPHDVPNAIVRAAEARAQGGNWKTAAEAAGWTLYGLRRWIRSHPRLWACELGRAWRASRDEACFESVALLRRKLRDEESKTVLEAAKIIGGQFAAKAKPRPAPPPDLPGQFLDLLSALPENEPARVDHHIQAAEDESRKAARRSGRRAD